MPLFEVFPWFGRAGVFDTGGDALNFCVLLLFCIAIYVVVGPQSLRRLPGVFWWLLAACAFMFAASLFAVLQLSTFALYLPSRYTRTTLMVLELCFIGANWVEFLDRIPSWIRRNGRLAIFLLLSVFLTLGVAYALLGPLFPWGAAWQLAALALRGGLPIVGVGTGVWCLQGRLLSSLGKGGLWRNVARVAALLAAGVVVAVAGGQYVRALEAQPIDPPQAARDVYEYVATLPKDAMLAGEPDVMTGIPAFSRRSVLIRGLFPRGPVVEYFDAQYAESPEVVVGFCERYSVDYLVLDAEVFRPAYLTEGEFFYQPYNDQIVDLVAGRSQFVLLQAEAEFRSGSLFVVKCDAEAIRSP
jgi:hypothetical protein